MPLLLLVLACLLLWFWFGGPVVWLLIALACALVALYLGRIGP